MTTRRAKALKGREFCMIRPDGRISDAELHEPILQQGDHSEATKIGKEAARRLGLSEAEIEKLYR